MKKGLLAVLTAAMVLSLSTMTAFAASPTVLTTGAPVATQKATISIADVASAGAFAANTSTSPEYKITPVSEATVASAKAATQNLVLNDLATTGKLLGNSKIEKAATQSNVVVTATLRSVVEVTPVTAQRNAAGLYDVTLTSPYFTAGGTFIVLHEDGTWEPIVPSATAANSVSFSSNLSPIAVVELSVKSAAKSPKTGETAPAAMMIILIGVAGAAVCGKKVFA